MLGSSSSALLLRQQDRNRFPERQQLEQASLPELEALAKKKGVTYAEGSNRFVIIDLLLKKSEIEARSAQEAQRHAQRLLREQQKLRDIQTSLEREEQLRSKDTGLTKEVTEAIDARIKVAKKTNVLDLSNTKDTHSSPLQLQQIPGKAISTFKMRKASAKGLKQLWLTNNRISEVSSELRLIKSLQVLCLSGNRLRKIPVFFGGLKRLRKLYLKHNEISDVPEQLQNLSHLEELLLDHNKLDAISLSLTHLRSLRRLGLSHNKIRHVPSEIRRLQNLVDLDLDHNSIGPSLPLNLSRLSSSLKILGVAHNFLAEFPACLNDLDLIVLRIEGNRSVEYVVKHEKSGLVLPDKSIPRRVCDGLLKTKTGDGNLTGYLSVAEDFTTDNARWFDESELEQMHRLIQNRAAVRKDKRTNAKRRASLNRQKRR